MTEFSCKLSFVSWSRMEPVLLICQALNMIEGRLIFCLMIHDCFLLVWLFHEQLIGIAPSPVLTRLVRLDNRVLCCTVMLCGVLVL